MIPKWTMKMSSDCSKNGTSVSGDLELTKMKQANNLVTTSAPELWRLPRGTARRRVNLRSPGTQVIFLECLVYVFMVNAADEF